MVEDLFARRMEKWAEEGELQAFNLAVVAEGLDIIKEMSDQNTGWEMVEQRVGEYKSWDPDILKVDKDTENKYWERLNARGTPMVFLSEEAGRVDINLDKPGNKLYIVCDPFDGSYLFKHGIPDFWYSSLALYDADFNGLSCAVGDAVPRNIAYVTDEGAFLAKLEGDQLVEKVRLNKKYRESMGRPDVTEMEGASIESYAMKPKKFLMPLVDGWRDLFLPFKFFLPNGGPYGFVDVAEGKIDVYFAVRQPYVDVFSGIQVAEKAEVVVTDFDGNPVKPHEDVKTVWDVVCSTNQAMHDQVLKAIAECRKKMG